jgi:hypothetical protein
MTMMVTLLLILFAGLALIFFVLRGIAATRTGSDEAALTAQMQPVDLEAFRNLADPGEEAFLRNSLSAKEFRTVQRLRLRAAIEYLAAVSHNAAMLVQLGQAARRSPDVQIAEAAQNLVDNALILRLYSALAIGKLCVRFLRPEASLQAAGILDRYQRVTEGALRLGRLQYPRRAPLLSRTL